MLCRKSLRPLLLHNSTVTSPDLQKARSCSSEQKQGEVGVHRGRDLNDERSSIQPQEVTGSRHDEDPGDHDESEEGA